MLQWVCSSVIDYRGRQNVVNNINDSLVCGLCATSLFLIVPFSKIILTKEIITTLLCCLNRTDSDDYGSKLLFYNLSLFFMDIFVNC